MLSHMSGNNIFLTDYLLKNLSKREVDAVIGHEVTHLQKKHIRMRLIVLFVCVGAMLGAGIWLGSRVPERFPSGPVFYALMLLTIFLVSRRNEFAADAGAAKLTGDPEAMITGLAKLSRLNTMPMQWGRIEEKTLTHPSMLRSASHGWQGRPESQRSGFQNCFTNRRPRRWMSIRFRRHRCLRARYFRRASGPRSPVRLSWSILLAA